jgi:hypothetical protein
LYAPTKKDAKNSLTRLAFMASSIRREVDPYLANKLSEVVCYAKEASGQVKEKEQWISCVEQSWYVFSA